MLHAHQAVLGRCQRPEVGGFRCPVHLCIFCFFRSIERIALHDSHLRVPLDKVPLYALHGILSDDLLPAGLHEAYCQQVFGRRYTFIHLP